MIRNEIYELSEKTLSVCSRMLADTTPGLLNINCCDPLGRSALLMAIDNENLEMVELLLDNKVRRVEDFHSLSLGIMGVDVGVQAQNK